MSGGSTPGVYANAAGGTLESVVITVLQGKGFSAVPWTQYSQVPERFGDELLLRNVPYQTIYGHPGKTEFVLRSARFHLDIRIECKWQQSAGSVDEKFPYQMGRKPPGFSRGDISPLAREGQHATPALANSSLGCGPRQASALK